MSGWVKGKCSVCGKEFEFTWEFSLIPDIEELKRVEKFATDVCGFTTEHKNIK